MKETNGKLFFGGIPTEADVNKIIQTVGIPKEGDLITYKQICEATGLERNSWRFRTVLTAWVKKLERDNSIVMIAIANEGLQHATPQQIIDKASRKHKSGFRCFHRAGTLAQYPDRSRLSEDERKTADVLTHNSIHLQLWARKEAKRITAEVTA